MESKIILLHGDILIKIKSQPSNDTNDTKTIFEEIENTNILNDDEKNKYLEFLNNNINHLTFLIMHNNRNLEIFINPIHPRKKIHWCNNFYFCKIFNHDENAIIKFANCTLYYDRVLINQSIRQRQRQQQQQHEEQQQEEESESEDEEPDEENDEEEQNDNEYRIGRNVCYKSKVQSECPICYDNTSCYRFYSCNHVQCFDCYLQMGKNVCVYRCNI
jgi:hypothetical protein